jgi:hypothetical protein
VIPVLCRILRTLADELEAAQPEQSDEWMDQHASPIGPRRHIAICRALLAQGDARALRAGRRWLLRSEALHEAPAPSGKARPTKPESAADRAARRLKGAA